LRHGERRLFTARYAVNGADAGYGRAEIGPVSGPQKQKDRVVHMRNLLLGAVAALTIAAPAQAVSYYSVGATATPGGPVDPGMAIGEVSLVDFDSAPHTGVTVSTTGSAYLHTGSTGSVAAAPAGDTSQYQALGTGGSATIDFSGYSQQLKSLSVYLGSIDSYNTVEVLNRAGQVLKTITGNDLPGQNGDWFASATNRRLYIEFNPSENVGALRFSSTGVAFEFDSIGASVAGVPEPASWALMIGGFGVVGGAMRRRQRVAVRFA
jgi:hypothetical protein